MANYKAVILAALCMVAASLDAQVAVSQGPTIGEEKQYLAAVFLNRANVSVGIQNNIGVFRLMPGDTGWTNIYRRNLFTFGLGIWKGRTSTRYYIAAGNGLHVSTDRGTTWRILTNWQTEDVLSVALDPVDSSVIYIGTPFGVFKSIDGGKQWVRKMKGMKRWFVKRVVIDFSNRRTLYASGEDDLYKSTDGAENWVPLRTGVRQVEVVVQDPSDSKHLLIGTEDDGVKVSLDGGMTWHRGKGLPSSAYYGMAASAKSHIMYTGGYKNGLWQSVNGGLSWTLLWDNPDIEAIYSIFVDSYDARHLMVGTSGQGVFESFDAGTTWRYSGLRGCHVKQIVAYP